MKSDKEMSQVFKKNKLIEKRYGFKGWILIMLLCFVLSCAGFKDKTATTPVEEQTTSEDPFFEKWRKRAE